MRNVFTINRSPPGAKSTFENQPEEAPGTAPPTRSTLLKPSVRAKAVLAAYLQASQASPKQRPAIFLKSGADTVSPINNLDQNNRRHFRPK